MAQPLTESDIIFPHLSNTPNFSATLSSLKRSALSITNRLNSITRDSEFVTRVAIAYGLPLVANERCGSWYIPLDLKASSVYFKSTDGHMGEWAFSLRRLNLQLLDVVSQHGGCVIVDSTRRGKSMPDALSKTVPFWCCVMNRAIFGVEKEGDEALDLFTPPSAVSQSESTQMERRINGFVQQFLDICKPDIPALRAKLRKPLRPLWVTQTSTVPHTAPEFPEFHPVILCTASRRVRGAEASEGGYIQGAADDHEAWSHGLTPALFWNNKDALLRTNEEGLPAKISSLVSQDRETDAVTTLVKPSTSLYISTSSHVDLATFDTVVSCTPEPLPQPHLADAGVKAYLHLACQTGKLGSRDLRNQLPALRSLTPTASGKTLICCPTGKDLSVGTALAYLCLYAADDGAVDLSAAKESRGIDKLLIKQRLSWITTSNPALNPSRATLQSVNSVLMSSETRKSVLAEVKNPADFDAEWALLPRPPTLELERLHTSPSVLGSASESDRALPNAMQSIFAAWQDSMWTFTRTLESVLPTHPSGRVTGTARFTRTPLANTLLYSETGEFVTETGMKFTARRRYVYQLIHPSESDESESKGEPFIRVRFFDDEVRRDSVDADGQGVGALFVEMGSLSLEGGELRAQNRAQHLCGEDLYAARWAFCRDLACGEDFSGGKSWWEVRYDVKGPKKEYVSSTRYTRGALEE
ncbi:tRNA A64-2'-O-ribosylphosphate transferase [Didymella sp. IMI 355093]|nr:tRNA A64-2'-O-ribosylphosphate transferase [Didymella sp. IMI 355093]